MPRMGPPRSDLPWWAFVGGVKITRTFQTAQAGMRYLDREYRRDQVELRHRREPWAWERRRGTWTKRTTMLNLKAGQP